MEQKLNDMNKQKYENEKTLNDIKNENNVLMKEKNEYKNINIRLIENDTVRNDKTLELMNEIEKMRKELNPINPKHNFITKIIDKAKHIEKQYLEIDNTKIKSKFSQMGKHFQFREYHIFKNNEQNNKQNDESNQSLSLMSPVSVIDTDGKSDAYATNVDFVESKDEEAELKGILDINDFCLIYSRSKEQWFKGKIINITGSGKTEWLVVTYGKTTKKIQRCSEYIRAIPKFHPENFRKGSKCKILDSQNWCDGKIEDIIHDEKGEWLRVTFVENGFIKMCDIQRYSDDIKVAY
eukprot:189319_1